jgi:hypothetical protein
MPASTLNQPSVVSGELLQQVGDRYDQGLYLQAYRLASQIKPLQD